MSGGSIREGTLARVSRGVNGCGAPVPCSSSGAFEQHWQWVFPAVRFYEDPIVAAAVVIRTRPRSSGMGLWLLALVVVNFRLQIVENGHWLTMLSVSQAYAEAGAADAVLFQSLGMVVRSAWKWGHNSHILVVVGWIFTLYCLLFRCAMVPRARAAIGMIASVLHFTGITLPVFAGYRMPFPELFGMPLGLANLVPAVWLMVKGFKEPYARPRCRSAWARGIGGLRCVTTGKAESAGQSAAAR